MPLNFQLLQVWKDVDGVLTCDPNIYPSARPVPHLTFEEAAELAYFGAQVCLHLLHLHIFLSDSKFGLILITCIYSRQQECY